MKVLLFDPQRRFGQSSPGTQELETQGPLVDAAIKLTSWLPTIIIVLAAAIAIIFISWIPAIVVALATDSQKPLYAFAVRDITGLLIGIYIYRRSREPLISCVPTNEHPHRPIEEARKAA